MGKRSVSGSDSLEKHSDSGAVASGADQSQCSLQLWGGCTLSSSDGRILEATGAEALILARAALDRSVTRAGMAAALWPDSRASAGNLRTRLHRLQQRAGRVLFKDGSVLSLVSDVKVLFPSAHELGTAGGAEPSRWTLLGDMDFTNHPELVPWISGARERWRQCLLEAVCGRLSETTEDMQARCHLLTWCIALEPLGEHWYRELMHCQASQGNRAGALLTYEQCKAALAEELGVLPDLATQQLHIALLQRRVEAVAASSGRADTDTPWPVLERDLAFEQVQRALDAGMHVMIEGEAGIGKTTLLRQLAQAHPICCVRAQPSDARCAYASLANLLSAVSSVVSPQLSHRVRSELSRVAPALHDDGDVPTTPFVMVRFRAALQAWVRAAALAGVRTIAIDDLHFADRSSLDCFAWLLEAGSQHNDSPAPGLILSCRSASQLGSLRDTAESLLSQGKLHHQTLVRLSQAAVTGLIRQVRPQWNDAPKVDAIYAVTGGNPLHARQLIESGRWRDETLMETLCAQVGEKFDAVSEETRLFAYWAALMEGPFNLDPAAHVLGQSLARLVAACAELERLGIFARGDYTHDLVREAVHRVMPASLKPWLHARIAQSLEQEGGSAQSCLNHWLLAGDNRRALPHALRYARWLTSLGQRESAFAVIQDVVFNPMRNVLADDLWCIAEFLPMARIGQLVSASALVPLISLCEQLLARQAELATPLAKAFSLHIQACIASELEGLVERAHALSLEAVRLVGEHPVALSELYYALASHGAYLDLPEAARHRGMLMALAERIADPSQRERCEQYCELVDRQRGSSAQLLRYWRGLRAAALRQGNMQAVRAYEYQLAHQCYAVCAFKSTIRLLRKTVDDVKLDRLTDANRRPYFYLVPAALQAGRFDLASAWMPAFQIESPLRCHLWNAWTRLVLGDIEAFKALWAQVRIKDRSPKLTLMYIVRGLIIQLYNRITGQADIEGVEDSIAMLNKLRDRTTGRWPARYEHAACLLIFEHTGCSPLPPEDMDALIARKERRDAAGFDGYLLLKQAEECAAQGDMAESARRARRAAIAIRKCRGPFVAYWPDLVARCIELLGPHDVALADDLRRRGARWVTDAANTLDEWDRSRFLAAHPGHATLLNPGGLGA